MCRSVASMARQGRVRKSVRPTVWPPPGLHDASGSGEGSSGFSLGPPPGLDAPWYVREPLFCSPGPAFMAGWMQPGVPAQMLIPAVATDGRHGAVNAQRNGIHELLELEIAKAVGLLADVAGGFASNDQCRLDLHGLSVELMRAFEQDVAWFGPLAEVGINIGLVLERASAQEGLREALHPLTLCLRNVVLLACARGFAPEDMVGPGLPQLLKVRLGSVIRAVQPHIAEEVCSHQISNLGVAKYQLFNAGVKFGRRRRVNKAS